VEQPPDPDQPPVRGIQQTDPGLRDELDAALPDTIDEMVEDLAGRFDETVYPAGYLDEVRRGWK
jgi:hypothetical protein